jgi:hypothetical protein
MKNLLPAKFGRAIRQMSDSDLANYADFMETNENVFSAMIRAAISKDFDRRAKIALRAA